MPALPYLLFRRTRALIVVGWIVIERREIVNHVLVFIESLQIFKCRIALRHNVVLIGLLMGVLYPCIYACSHYQRDCSCSGEHSLAEPIEDPALFFGGLGFFFS